MSTISIYGESTRKNSSEIKLNSKGKHLITLPRRRDGNKNHLLKWILSTTSCKVVSFNRFLSFRTSIIIKACINTYSFFKKKGNNSSVSRETAANEAEKA